MIKWPQEVVSDIARRRCVIFLGSGVSANSQNAQGRRPKTWLGFMQALLPSIVPNVHIRRLLKEKDYLTACEIIKRVLGRGEFTRVLTEEFLTPAYHVAQIHKEIFSLDSRIVATPNFDKIYETYANGQAHGSIVVKHHYDEDVNSVIRGSGRVILKVHGTIDNPDRMIFTRTEYARARTEYSSFYAILEALSLTHTFIFIGCGVNDPDTRLLLEDIFFRHNSSRSHIILLPKKSLHESVLRVVQDTMNLSVINYSDRDNHKELLDSIANLNLLVENEREELKESLNW